MSGTHARSIGIASLDTALLCSRGHILCHFGPELRPELPTCLPILLDHLKKETAQLTAVRALNTIARCLTKLQWKSTHPVFCVTSRLCLVLSVVLCYSCCVCMSCAGHSHLASSFGDVVRSPNCVDLSPILVSQYYLFMLGSSRWDLPSLPSPPFSSFASPPICSPPLPFLSSTLPPLPSPSPQNMFQTLKYLGLLGVPTFIAGNRLLRKIAQARK